MSSEIVAVSILVSSFFEVLVFLTLIFAAVLIFRMILFGSRSQQHRKLLTNLYVAGKIRQLAKKDDIDLNEEMKELLRTLKEQRKYIKPLDDTIELELQDKIMKEAEMEKKK